MSPKCRKLAELSFIVEPFSRSFDLILFPHHNGTRSEHNPQTRTTDWRNVKANVGKARKLPLAFTFIRLALYQNYNTKSFSNFPARAFTKSDSHGVNISLRLARMSLNVLVVVHVDYFHLLADYRLFRTSLHPTDDPAVGVRHAAIVLTVSPGRFFTRQAHQ